MSVVNIGSIPNHRPAPGVRPRGPRLVTGHHSFQSAGEKEFPPFRLDTVNQCLWRRADSGEELRVILRPKSFAILRYLVDHAGRLVTQDELLGALWPGTHVQPEVLKRHIFDVRDVLGDDPKHPTYIETVTRRGYRFSAAVRSAASAHEIALDPLREVETGVYLAAGSARLADSTAVQLTPGAQLGPYRILSLVGAGGMGEVYKAHDTRLDRIVAIKRLKQQHCTRFEQEARMIAGLNHPHICQIYDVGLDYLVLEYVEGQPVHGPVPAEEARRLAQEIASALQEAHGRGIVHRDLKPANILIDIKGSAKLLDFGLARTRGSDETITIEGTVLGTAPYMSPEQAQGKPLDQRSDIFSFGTVLYELLSGQRAFTGSSTLDILNAVVNTEPAALKGPAPLRAIVARCLHKAPAERFRSMTEILAALNQASVEAVAQQPSIAVLPFLNMSSSKDDEYFGDGLAEEILNVLTQVAGLKVVSRTSAFAFRGKNEDIRKIAEVLGVTNALVGSVRRDGSRLRVTAQLICAADGTHLWSQRYDRELTDTFAVQDDIAAAIAGALQVKLTGNRGQAASRALEEIRAATVPT